MVRVFVDLGPAKQSSFDQPLALLSECHRRIERFLGDMLSVVKLRRGGALEDADRSLLAGGVQYFSVAAPRHTADEEESLFPRLRSAREKRVQSALEEIERLEDDHRRADVFHAQANALAGRWLAEGALDSADVNQLEELLESLAAIYRDHIAIEDARVFPAAGAVLTAEEQQAIGREMAARRGLDFDRVVGQRPGMPRSF